MMTLLLLLSRQSHRQWKCWQAVRVLSTHIVPAEVAQRVAQHGQGLVHLPEDVVATLDGYFKDSGLTGKQAKLRSLALTEQLKALSRSQAKGGMQPYRDSAGAGAGAAGAATHQPPSAMTREQLQEQAAMEAELEQMAAVFGPKALDRHRQARAAAQAAAGLALPTTRSGRISSKAKAAVLEHISVHGMLAVPHEHLRAALDLPPSSSLANPERTMALKKVTPAYNESQALAYALARLPGCYAASMRIFKELAVRLPGFRPKTLLDFGAGPGTASWAAQEAWPESLSRLSAVEPSAAMRRLGERLEAARRFAHPHAPLVRWRPELPAVPRGQRQQQAAQGRADVVVASYVLGEIADPQERAALLRQLWGLTSELLVLIEPGTPAGAANIQDARTAILQHEARRTAKLQRRLTAVAPAWPTDSSSSGSGPAAVTAAAAESPEQQQLDPNLAAKLGSKWYGAHVVSPCPHDGACPLAAPGTKAWCHFGTRFQRPSFMQAAKALPGTHVNPMDHQDERYSYVVIRRGSRPAVATQVDISRTFLAGSRSSPVSPAEGEQQPDAGSSADSDSEPTAEVPQQSTTAGSTWTAGLPSGTHRQESAALPGTQQAQQLQRRLLFGDMQQQAEGQHGVRQQPESPAAATPMPAAAEGDVLTSNELQALSSLLAGPQPDASYQALQQAGESSAALGDHYKRVNAKLDVFGQGLVNRLIALEDAGVDWIAGGSNGLSLQLATQAASTAVPAPERLESPGTDCNSSTIDSSSLRGPRMADVIDTGDSNGLSLQHAAQAASTAVPAPERLESPRTDCNSSTIDSSSMRGPCMADVIDTLNSHSIDDSSSNSSSSSGSSTYTGKRLAAVGSDFVPKEQQEQQEQPSKPQQQMPLQSVALHQAAAASATWPRIVRPPRKRGGHVILDVCAPCSSDPLEAGTAQDLGLGRGAAGSVQAAGQLERHVVARSDTRKWMGEAAYKMAQHAQWGDLWPSAYNTNAKKQVLK